MGALRRVRCRSPSCAWPQKFADTVCSQLCGITTQWYSTTVASGAAPCPRLTREREEDDAVEKIQENRAIFFDSACDLRARLPRACPTRAESHTSQVQRFAGRPPRFYASGRRNKSFQSGCWRRRIERRKERRDGLNVLIYHTRYQILNKHTTTTM